MLLRPMALAYDCTQAVCKWGLNAQGARPPVANLSDTRKILHGINRLEERIIRMERAQAGGRVINDGATQGPRREPWVKQLSAHK
jgi:hypothetical protein